MVFTNLRTDKEFILQVLQVYKPAFEYVDETLKNDKEILAKISN